MHLRFVLCQPSAAELAAMPSEPSHTLPTLRSPLAMAIARWQNNGVPQFTSAPDILLEVVRTQAESREHVFLGV